VIYTVYFTGSLEKTLGYTLPTYEKLKLQQIVANDLNSVANDDLSEISGEIEDGLKQR